MKLIIAGSRKYDLPVHFIEWCLFQKGLDDIEFECIISGKATGVDYSGEQFAKAWNIAVDPYPAKWKDLDVPGAVIKQGEYGPYNAVAGHQRNQQMADKADALLLIWNGTSKGSADMKERMEKLGKPVYEVILKV